MRKKLCYFLFLIASHVAVGQDITVSATVVDKESNEPLGYASVGLKSVAIGTISNADGQFDFHMPAEYRNEVLVISMLLVCHQLFGGYISGMET